MKALQSQECQVVIRIVLSCAWKILTPVALLLGIIVFRSEVVAMVRAFSDTVAVVTEKTGMFSGTLILVLAGVLFSISALCLLVKERIAEENVSSQAKDCVNKRVALLQPNLEKVMWMLSILHILSIPWSELDIVGSLGWFLSIFIIPFFIMISFFMRQPDPNNECSSGAKDARSK